MAHDENTVQIDFPMQRMSRGVIPRPKLLQMFEVNDRSSVVLSKVAAIEEVHVNRCRDDPVRRKQPAEIQISGCGILERIVVAVRKHGEREGASPAGHANMSIKRYV